MKKIDEKLGVPDEIIDAADFLFKNLMRFLEYQKIDTSPLSQGDDYVIVSLGKHRIKIGDLLIDSLPIFLEIKLVRQINEPTLVSVGYGNAQKFKSTGSSDIALLSTIDNSNLAILVAAPENSDSDGVKNAIKKDLTKSVIAHELMHIYDAYKTKTISIDSFSSYSAFSDVSGYFPKPILDFSFLLYYVSSLENTVRATELYSMMLENGVDKDTFRDFMKNNDVIKNLTRAEEFSIDKMKDELNNCNQSKKLLKKLESGGYKRMGHEIADDILNIFVINLINSKFDIKRTLLGKYIKTDKINSLENFIDSLMGIEREYDEISAEERANNYLEKMIKKYEKYSDNPEKYFRELEKSINLAGTKMKRKLYKLYDMLENNEKRRAGGDDDKKIINWDLHTKINKRDIKKENFILDFSRFKLR
jgi:hypothetical protein